MPRERCPFCEVHDADRTFYRDDLIAALWDGFPVSPGHALIVPRRHVATWFDASPEEQAALMQALEVARREVAERYAPDGFNVGINVGEAAGQTVFHLHVHLIPRYKGDVPDPRGGVRHVIPAKANYLTGWHVHANRSPRHWRRRPLVRGGSDPMLPHLVVQIDRATKVEIAVAFVRRRGVDLLERSLRDLLARGGSLRFLTGDYLGGTEPEALDRLLELTGDAELRVFEAGRSSFHPKAYIFHDDEGAGIAYVGSSNLTEIALTSGLEWNYELVGARDGEGFKDVVHAFDALFSHESTRPLDAAWIEAYRRRRPTVIVERLDVAVEPADRPPAPHSVQEEALAALAATRRDGNAAGLVVLATGLGKTWLSAFDSARPEFRRVLFVAHREEILAQAWRTFRRVRPDATLGLYTGQERTADADVVFASVQTLGKQAHLDRFFREDFDYVIVDEFHHAAAATYRRLIDYFRPKFLLGLTATPERTDGGDLLALCGENLVYRCDLFEGIRRRLLCPFHYFGVPDEVDYRNIPWRSARFDEEALTLSLATEARAENALEQYRKHRGARTLAFCCSQRHADFMVEYFRRAGVNAVAVHSGPSSAPRETSVQSLSTGEVEILFAVDMFNEGLDVPAIDTVMMLRPTESRVVWLQQFGRGLRVCDDKPYVTVIDYIGNHRVFLTKPRALLGVPAGHVHMRQALARLETKTIDLPDGCEVTYELEAIKLLREAVPPPAAGDTLVEYYREFVDLHGVRPRAVEAFHDDVNPRAARQGYGSWLEFVRVCEGLSADERAALDASGDFLRRLEVTPMVRSFKMLLLGAMLAVDALPGAASIETLLDGFAEIARRSSALRDDVGVALDDRRALRRLLVENPVAAWAGGAGTGGVAYFAFDGATFRTTDKISSVERQAFRRLVRELVEWRLAEYLSRTRRETHADGAIIAKVSHASGRPILFLDRKKYPETPVGWTAVRVEGEVVQANFVKVAVNVARRPGGTRNELPELLRHIFGAQAGAPGTRHHVVFKRDGAMLTMRAVEGFE